MAIDPEELKQRRLQRQQQRQKKRRSTIVRLVVAGIAVVLVTILILALTSGDAQQNPPSETTQNIAATQAPEDTVIHLTAAGDLHITESIVAAGGAEHNYTTLFLDVAHLLADADVTAVNLEGNFYDPPYGTDRSAPASMGQALASAGVDYVQLANSYSIYKGMDGLQATINAVRLAGMEPLGVYGTRQEAKAGKGYTLQTIQGVKIAFVAFTKGMDGMALPAGNEGCVNVLYKDYSTDYQVVDTEGISQVLDAVEEEKPDLTVAFLHWGSEYNDNISKTQTQIRDLMQEKGVDAIIGTHSHYVQKMEYDPDSGAFVAYSLGDLIGDAERAGSEYSVILELEITKKAGTGETKVTGFRYTPIFAVKEENRPVQILRIREAMKAYEEGYLDRVSQEVYDAMAYALTRIEARVTGN